MFKPSRTLALSVLALSTTSALALEFPDLKDPAERALIDKFTKDYALVNASPDFFKMPDRAPAWPCPVDDKTIYTAAGLIMAHPELSKDLNKQIGKSLRESGFTREQAAGAKQQYSNVRIVPIKAECTGGKLDGDVEVLATYDTLMETKNMGNSTKRSSQDTDRVLSQYKNGTRVALQRRVAKSIIKMEMHFDDPNVQAAVDKNNASAGLDKPTEMVVYQYEVMQDKPVSAYFYTSIEKTFSASLFGVNTRESEVTNSTFTTTLPGDKTSMVMYKNKNLFSSMITNKQTGYAASVTYVEDSFKKNGLDFRTTPGFENAKAIVIDGKDMIEMHGCMKDMKPIKVATCPVD